MAWDDLDEREYELKRALARFDWESADKICEAIIDRLPAEDGRFPENKARSFLQALRRKRRFRTMGLLAQGFLESGLNAAQIRRQYGQALIDQGMLNAAKSYLEGLINDPGTNLTEQAEAHGLIGRIYKQTYVNESGKANPARAQQNLQRAFDEYALSYAADPKSHTWHGINMVALLVRAERDKIGLREALDYRELARSILDTLDKKEEICAAGLPAWDVATQIEAYLALGDFDKAAGLAKLYVESEDADNFEISSTLRQLLEVWQLSNDRPPGYTLIPLLRAAQLSKEGGGLIVPLQEARQDLEKVFGADSTRSLKWYKEGLEWGKSVCRIERADGKGIGTGWLVKSTDFFAQLPLRPMVLTNAHVVSTTSVGAIQPPNAWVNFQLLGRRIQVKSIVWSSPVGELDGTFLDLAEDLTAQPMDLYADEVKMAEPGPRMYIMGHPGGRDLEWPFKRKREL